jgi:hypothetical protein
MTLVTVDIPVRAMTPRRFPPPWPVQEPDACFVVRDRGGQQLAYLCFQHELGRRSAAISMMRILCCVTRQLAQ